MTDEEDGSFSDALQFDLRLLIRHLSMDPDVITRVLGLEPFFVNRAGAARKAPNGTPLGGFYKENAWSYSAQHDGKRSFFDEVMNLVARLEPHAGLLNEVVKTGGTIELIVNLDGHNNIGDTLPSSQMARLIRLNIGLGIEVFPEFS